MPVRQRQEIQEMLRRLTASACVLLLPRAKAQHRPTLGLAGCLNVLGKSAGLWICGAGCQPAGRLSTGCAAVRNRRAA
jgi:hypothetical protein